LSFWKYAPRSGVAVLRMTGDLVFSPFGRDGSLARDGRKFLVILSGAAAAAA